MLQLAVDLLCPVVDEERDSGLPKVRLWLHFHREELVAFVACYSNIALITRGLLGWLDFKLVLQAWKAIIALFFHDFFDRDVINKVIDLIFHG